MFANISLQILSFCVSHRFRYEGQPGDLLLVPSTDLHSVEPVTKGNRMSVALFNHESSVRKRGETASLDAHRADCAEPTVVRGRKLAQSIYKPS